MNFITTLLGNLNYGTILFLMLLESTVVPVPSEFVVTPAAYHAASGQLAVSTAAHHRVALRQPLCQQQLRDVQEIL